MGNFPIGIPARAPLGCVFMNTSLSWRRTPERATGSTSRMAKSVPARWPLARRGLATFDHPGLAR